MAHLSTVNIIEPGSSIANDFHAIDLGGIHSRFDGLSIMASIETIDDMFAQFAQLEVILPNYKDVLKAKFTEVSRNIISFSRVQVDEMFRIKGKSLSKWSKDVLYFFVLRRILFGKDIPVIHPDSLAASTYEKSK